MTAAVSIRAGTAHDVDALVAFNQAMALETEDKHLSAGTLRPGVEGVFEDPRRGFYLVAQAPGPSDRPGQVVGALMVTYEWSDWRNGDFWWVQSVYVTAAYRGKGVYTALYDEVRRRAHETGGVCGVRLYVERENVIAQQVYQRLGMQETAYLMYEEEFKP